MKNLMKICFLLNMSLLATVGWVSAETQPTQPEEVQSSELEGLTPAQQDELKIETDEVMNPYPG
jgi:hypothetical protein